MDFMTVLPPEIIEEVLLYLTSKEIMNCSKVCKAWEKTLSDEILWRHLCGRNGFDAKSKEVFTKETDVQTWREYYLSIVNWQNMHFVDHIIEDDGAIEQVQLCGTSMLIPGKGRIRIWDIHDVPKFVQELETITCKTDGFCLRVSGNFIVYESGSIVQIFQKNSNFSYSLSKVFYFNNKKLNFNGINDLFEEYSDTKIDSRLRDREMNFNILVELNDTNLSVFQGEVLFIWSLKTWYKQVVVIPEFVNSVFAVKIQFPRLCLVTLIDRKYIIKVYDLLHENWLMDLLHITDEDQKLMLQPRLILGKHYIVSAGVCVQDPMASSVIHLKVWRTDDGSLISTLNIPYCYFNCFLVNNIIILTISSNVIAVWNPLKNSKIRKLTLYDNKFSLIKPISNNLLVVSYCNFFEVWNWKTGKKLYETEPRYVCSYNQKMNSLFYIQPDAENNNMLAHEFYKPKKILIYNFSG